MRPRHGPANYLRFQLSPISAIALAARIKRAGQGIRRRPARALSLPRTARRARSPYERLLGDAMAGDGALFTRQDAVEAAWAVVDPVLVEHHARPCPTRRAAGGRQQADALDRRRGRLAQPDARKHAPAHDRHERGGRIPARRRQHAARQRPLQDDLREHLEQRVRRAELAIATGRSSKRCATSSAMPTTSARCSAIAPRRARATPTRSGCC